MSTAFDELRSRIEGLFALATRGGDYITATQFNAILEITFPPKLPVKEYTGQPYFPATLPVETVSVIEPFYADTGAGNASVVESLYAEPTQELPPEPIIPGVVTKMKSVKVPVQVYRCGDGFSPSGWYELEITVDYDVASVAKTIKLTQLFNPNTNYWTTLSLHRDSAKRFGTYSIATVLYGSSYYGLRRRNLGSDDTYDFTRKNFIPPKS